MTDINPRDSDLVLGGQNPPPVDAAILGGLAGVKQRLASESIAGRLQALNNAIEYGDKAIDLALQSLTDEAVEVRRLAKTLLCDRLEEAGKKALLDRDPLSYFTTFNNWQREVYNPEVGITDPQNNAYVVDIYETIQGNGYSFDISKFKALIEDPRVGELEALICEVHSQEWEGVSHCRSLIVSICDAAGSLKKIKALFFGQAGDYDPYEFMSRLIIVDIRPFLTKFPDLEMLQVRGLFTEQLNCEGIYHERIKTLIIETSYISSQNVEQICNLTLPNLEYLEFSLGGDSIDVPRKSMERLISGLTAPRLRYLGICYSDSYYNPDDNTHEWIDTLVESSFLKQLYVLDLSQGHLTDDIAKIFIANSNLGNLKILNLSGNLLSPESIALLELLPCKVVTYGQHDPQEDRYYAASE
jgi:hypothetical protein